MAERIGGIYQHFKGDVYRVFGLGAHTETDEKFVTYIPLSAEHEEEPELQLRPRGMFFELVEVDGEQKPRFTKLSEDEVAALESMHNDDD